MIIKFTCWLGYHDWLCVWRVHRSHGIEGAGGTEETNWQCSRCPKTRTEQWDV